MLLIIVFIFHLYIKISRLCPHLSNSRNWYNLIIRFLARLKICAAGSNYVNWVQGMGSSYVNWVHRIRFCGVAGSNYVNWVQNGFKSGFRRKGDRLHISHNAVKKYAIRIPFCRQSGVKESNAAYRPGVGNPVPWTKAGLRNPTLRTDRVWKAGSYWMLCQLYSVRGGTDNFIRIIASCC